MNDTSRIPPIVLDRTPLRASYVYIHNTRHNDLKDEDEYSITLLIPKDAKESLTLLRSGAKAAILKKWGKVPKGLKQGLKDGDAYREEGENRGEEYIGHYFIRCATTRPPTVLNARKEAAKEGDITSGDYVFAIVNPYAWEAFKKGTKIVINKGFSFGLQAIMFAKKGDPLGTVMTEEQAQELFANAEAQVDGFDDTDDNSAALFGSDDDDDDDLLG